ncbi:MAG: hypothetical protein IT427_06820 [Pirellulales bacterium]|nr:hypothetical protein [Pirellulales bacterium]
MSKFAAPYDQRFRKGHADANISLLRRTAQSLLKINSIEKVGMKTKRLCAARDDDYRLQVPYGKCVNMQSSWVSTECWLRHDAKGTMIAVAGMLGKKMLDF